LYVRANTSLAGGCDAHLRNADSPPAPRQSEAGIRRNGTCWSTY